MAQFLKSVGSKAQIILADPVGSTLAGIVNDGVPGPEGSYTVEGIGQNFVPDTADMSLIDKAYSIPDAEAIATARELLLKEGILAGSSTGTLLAAGVDEAEDPLPLALGHERLTTVSAQRSLRAAGVRAKQQRAVIDQAAAVAILQSWLDQRRATPTGPVAGERTDG